MLTIVQLSALLNIKASTLYAWASQGKIPHVKIHGLIRFQSEEIQHWLEVFKTQKVLPLKLKEQPALSATRLDALIVRAKRKAYNHDGETRPQQSSPHSKGGH